MTDFIEGKPLPESCWRAIVLLGQNTASHKFALAQSLLELANAQREQITLEDLAEPFSSYICQHLKIADKQCTVSQSRFLDICRQFNSGEISKDELISGTARRGFRYVLDAFHVIGTAKSPVEFFHQEGRGRNRSIRLTDELLKLPESIQYINLPKEVEARWRLVETAWELGISSSVLLPLTFDRHIEELIVEPASNHRRPVTNVKNAINGYQKGKCFYCETDISLDSYSNQGADVDHFIERNLQHKIFVSLRNSPYLDGVWNLVLACVECNRGVGSKVGQVPNIDYLKKLHERNEFYIKSHHPLRETLILQTGNSEEKRRSFLNEAWNLARKWGLHSWHPIRTASISSK